MEESRTVVGCVPVALTLEVPNPGNAFTENPSLHRPRLSGTPYFSPEAILNIL